MTERTVDYHTRKHGLWFRPKWRYRGQEDWDRILSPYRTLEEAAEGLGIGESALRKALKRNSIEHRFSCFYMKRKLEDVDTETLVELYEQNERRSYRVAALLGVHVVTVQEELRRRGVKVFAWQPTRERIYPGRKS